MTITEQVQSDVTTAAKARDQQRLSALRLVLDALKKEAKDARGDLDEQAEIAVLQRERKRRAEAAEAFRNGGRAEQAEKEEAEAAVIDRYLPEQLSDPDLEALVSEALAETGASSPKEMGKVMSTLMPKVAGRADGKRVSELVRSRLHVRAKFTLDAQVAAELAGTEDAVLRALEGHLSCGVFLRGNVLTLDGSESDVKVGKEVVRELSELIGRGHEIAPGTIEAITSALDQHESPSKVLGDVVWTHRSNRIAPKTVNQKRYVDSIRNNTITFAIGPAGTGKTYLAMAMATAALARRDVSRIILTRPAVEAGERLGFLPGTIMEKVDPYLRPLFDAMYDMLEADKVNVHLERGVIEVAPLAYMRGRTLNDAFIILDEAQNTTPEQMKMFLTRLGFNSTMVVTGDITQIDLPRDQRSGLVVVREILGDVTDIDFIAFTGEDVVRHKLVQRIVEAYADHAKTQAPGLRPARTGKSA